MKITDYKLLDGGNVQDLTRQVSEALKEGWQPFSSPTSVQNGIGRVMYAQAIVKYGESTDSNSAQVTKRKSE